MAVDEAYANAVEHGCFNIDNSELELEYLVFDDRLEIYIRDTGRGFDSGRIDILANLKEPDSLRGRGLGLINALSDDFDLVSELGEGTKIKITKYLKLRCNRKRGKMSDRDKDKDS